MKAGIADEVDRRSRSRFDQFDERCTSCGKTNTAGHLVLDSRFVSHLILSIADGAPTEPQRGSVLLFAGIDVVDDDPNMPYSRHVDQRTHPISSGTAIGSDAVSPNAPMSVEA